MRRFLVVIFGFSLSATGCTIATIKAPARSVPMSLSSVGADSAVVSHFRVMTIAKGTGWAGQVFNQEPALAEAIEGEVKKAGGDAAANVVMTCDYKNIGCGLVLVEFFTLGLINHVAWYAEGDVVKFKK